MKKKQLKYLKQYYKKYRKIEPLKKTQHNKTENVAGSVRLRLFMDSSDNCKLPPMPSSTGLSRIQHLNRIFANYYKLLYNEKKKNFYTFVHITV